jgi:hypothetical protein
MRKQPHHNNKELRKCKQVEMFYRSKLSPKNRLNPYKPF